MSTPLLVFSKELKPISKLLIRERKGLKTEGVAPGCSPTTCILRSHWQRVIHPWAIKQLPEILKTGKCPSKYIVPYDSFRKTLP